MTDTGSRMNMGFYKSIEFRFWLKRFICGIISLILLYVGANLTISTEDFSRIIGFFIFIGGITLAYITVMEQLPKYNFWITLTALGLAYALYVVHIAPTAEEREIINARLDAELEKSKHLLGRPDSSEIDGQKKAQTQNNSSKFKLAAYPKISGSITVLDAHVYKIEGRYIRLYGVDAPDSDQICADARGTMYNCGEEAASWVRGWIDKNLIDCYILKIVPNGQDLATCIWGEYDIGAALVSSGWGLAKSSETTIYKPYEAKAQSEYSGLWQGTFYAPEDWRDIKRRRQDFTIKRRTFSKKSKFFDFRSWF